MSGKILRFDAPTHKAVDALLPWYVNGTLEPAELDLVERHLTECARCRKEVAWLRDLREACRSGVGDDARALGKLGAHLDAQRPSARPPGRLARALQPWPLRYVALAQLATIAVLGALWLYHPQPESVYRTLSSADASATRTGTLVVVFDPEAREPEMRQALRAAAAHIVSGPTQQGAYLVDVADPDLERAADNLRHQHAVVLVAPLQRADKP